MHSIEQTRRRRPVFQDRPCRAELESGDYPTLAGARPQLAPDSAARCSKDRVAWPAFQRRQLSRIAAIPNIFVVRCRLPCRGSAIVIVLARRIASWPSDSRSAAGAEIGVLAGLFSAPGELAGNGSSHCIPKRRPAPADKERAFS